MDLVRGDKVKGRRDPKTADTWTVIECRGKTHIRARHDRTGVPTFIRHDELDKNWKRVERPHERTT